jgi:hypothetical protein
MLEPTLACNTPCIGCGKIREYESNKARPTVEEASTPVRGARAGRVDLWWRTAVYKGIEDVVAACSSWEEHRSLHERASAEQY